MQDKVDTTIKSFYIFNPKFGSKEGEEEKKIFYYYPPKTDITTQIKTVGLSEAIIKFTQTFVTKEECRSVHTLKTRQYFHHAESDYWIVLTINLPLSKSKNEEEITYHPENIHDEVYLSILKQSYDMYKLFVGSFESLIAENSLDTSNLKLKLSQFFNRYLHYMNVTSCDIIDVFEGMQYLPLDKRTYLHAQSFMNQFQCEFFNEVRYSVLLVRNNVVWSNIESPELRIIYRYLVTNLLSPYLSDDSSNEGNSSGECSPNEINVGNDTNVGRFITCPPFYANNSTTMTKVPKLFIKDLDGKNVVCQLLVYNVVSSFICMFIPENIEISMDLLKLIETFLRMKLTVVASEICLHKEKKRSSRPNTLNNGAPFCYIYFNRLNLAQKNTLNDMKNNLPAEVLSVLTDICFDKKRNSPSCETIVKTYDDYWVVGQFCNEREFFVIAHQKNTTLIEISEEMKKIREKHLKSIFFHV